MTSKNAGIQTPLVRILSERTLGLIARAAPDPLMQRHLQDLLAGADPLELWHIQAYELAHRWGTDPAETLEALLLGTTLGLFDLHWLHHCPSCNAASGHESSLGTVAEGGHCGLCNLDFVNALDDNIEVVFSAAADLVDYPPQLQETFRSEMMRQIRAEGRFQKDVRRVSGLDCLNTPLFRDLFGDQVLPSDRSLHVRNLPILFTDIRGSTALYERAGDTRAFTAVRAHFSALFQSIAHHRGAVVKTIGDAVMATFPSNRDALSAALEALAAFPQTSDGLSIDVKMGLHAGPCIAVTLNERVDYFGRNVNLAARVQGVAQGGELVVTRDLLTCPHCADVVRGMAASLSREFLPLKGIATPTEIFRLRPRLTTSP